MLVGTTTNANKLNTKDNKMSETIYGKLARMELEKNDIRTDVEPDSQESWNHVTCEAGEDTRGRLYVKGTDTGVMWHCFNCGISGYFSRHSELSAIRAVEPASISTSKESHVSIMLRFGHYKDEGFSEEIKIWLEQYEFDEGMCDAYDIRASAERLVLPVWYKDHVVGHQQRTFSGGNAKYLTFSNQNYSYLKHDENPLLIIVEDLLSSYKLNSVGYNVVALMGTKLDKGVLDIIKDEEYTRVLLWLDKDEAGQKASMQLYRELNPVVNVDTLLNDQAKELSFKVLQSFKKLEGMR